MTCFVSRPSGITLVKFQSLQVTIKTNLLADYMHYMFQLISVGTLKLVQGSLLCTISIRKWYHRRNCQPVQQPVGYAYPYCVCLPEMVKSWRRPPDHFSPPPRSSSPCSLLMRNLLFLPWSHKRLSKQSLCFFITSDLHRHFGDTSAIL